MKRLNQTFVFKTKPSEQTSGPPPPKLVIMEVTEDFSFPRISDTCPLTIQSPPLWNNPSSATDKETGKSKVVIDDEKYEKDEDSMDILWENFNEDLYSTTSASATSSSTEVLFCSVFNIFYASTSSLCSLMSLIIYGFLASKVRI